MRNKCAHPACSCPVPEKWMYCSAQCASGNPGNATCGCGHQGCKATKTVDGRIKPGGSARDIEITGGLKTHGSGVPPLEQQGAIDSFRVTGGCVAAGGGFDQL